MEFAHLFAALGHLRQVLWVLPQSLNVWVFLVWPMASIALPSPRLLVFRRETGIERITGHFVSTTLRLQPRGLRER